MSTLPMSTPPMSTPPMSGPPPTMITSFTERMVGPITAVPPHLAAPVDLRDRRTVLADDVVALARTLRVRPESEVRDRSALDLDRLLLRVGRNPDGRDGYRSEVASGRVGGLGGIEPRPVLAGFADLLARGGPGDRRMYYRLMVGPVDDLRIVEGVKVVRGSAVLAWRQTTTLYTRVSRPRPGADPYELLLRPDRPVSGAVPVSGGVLRILPADLVRQVLSMRGRVPSFLVGFGLRLLVR